MGDNRHQHLIELEEAVRQLHADGWTQTDIEKEVGQTFDRMREEAAQRVYGQPEPESLSNEEIRQGFKDMHNEEQEAESLDHRCCCSNRYCDECGHGCD